MPEINVLQARQAITSQAEPNKLEPLSKHPILVPKSHPQGTKKPEFRTPPENQKQAANATLPPYWNFRTSTTQKAYSFGRRIVPWQTIRNLSVSQAENRLIWNPYELLTNSPFRISVDW